MELTYNKKHYIYMTTDLETFKIYVGYHYGYIDDNYYGSGKMILDVIKNKVPVAKVVLEIVDENTWPDRERFWILYFNSTDLSIGYNLMEGGSCGPRMVGENNPMFGKTHTEEARKNLSEKSKQKYIDEPERRIAISNRHKGKVVSDEFRESKRIAMLGNIPKNSKPCKYDGVIYPSLAHLAKFLGITQSAVKGRINAKIYGIELL